MRSGIFFLLTLVVTVSAWDDGDLEVFDVVEEVNQNFYELIGVTQDASPAEIKSAFKKLTLKLHPDKNDAPDADVQFRNLVSVHNVLKDPSKREKYNEVLKNGLPNWRSAIYYYRHVRKMGLAEGSIILFIIITFGQYAVGWAAYAEKRFTAEQILNSRGKKHARKGFDAGLAEILEQLPKPSVTDTLPFQIPRLLWWLVTALPRGIEELKRRKKEREEELKRQKRREEEERVRATREAAAAAEAKELRGLRKRRGFVPPERAGGCLLDPADAPEGPVAVPVQTAAPVITGGLWTDDDLAELVRLVKKHPGGAPERWERIAAAMGRSVPEVTHMAAKLKDNCYKIPGQEEAPPAPLEPPKKVKTRKAEESSGGSWSQTQQKALEAALAKHPKGGAADRWQKIAAAVPGKTKTHFITDSTVSKYERASSCALDEATVHLYHCFKRVYADILHRWQLIYKKTEVLKLVQCKYEKSPPKHLGPEIAAECAYCGAVCRGGARCAACRRLALRCAVCALAVRGLACACAYCGHAGHAHHMLKWFAQRDTCPTGCGCKCLIDGYALWKGVKYA